jgi:tetratricopeptide (TPR) repeat protein
LWGQELSAIPSAKAATRRFAEAIPWYEMALASNRNWVSVLFAIGQCKLYSGSIEETILLVEQAIRLSPRDPILALGFARTKAWNPGLP